MAFWAVVTTQPKCEHRALNHLEWQGFTAYAPKEKTVRVVHGRKVHGWRWLFPRYLFVWIEEQWHALLSTIGISDVLMTGEYPARLPNGWVETMKRQEVKGLITLSKHRFKKGQRVEVTGGLFAGAKALYQGMSTRDREIVILEALGARVELASGLLRVT